ncbi:MAG: Chitin binding protein [Verrucomicrobiales bacterium]|nr:Chitin binding protein [Verrucomicrobiales bacterium]
MAERLAFAFARKLLPPLLLFALSAAAQAQFTYTTENGQIAITGYDCSSGAGAVTIPSTIDGLPVTSIGGVGGTYYKGAYSKRPRQSSAGFYQGAFWGCTSLTSVTIPNSVTNIGNATFTSCSRLTSVILPNRITTLPDGTFSNCASLTNVTVPNSVTSIGLGAFSGCTSLTVLDIPDGVSTIGDRAFEYCSSLSNVTIPDSVTSIGEWAFSECSAIAKVTLPNTITAVPDSAFYGCSRLTSVTIPDSVTSIGDAAFAGCTSLTGVIIPNSVTGFGTWAFQGCTGLTSVTIPNTVTTISDSAFHTCSSLASVMIPDSVTSIARLAFVSCTSLKIVTIPHSVTNIGEAAFAGCTGLTNIAVDPLNSFYSSQAGVLFNKRQTTLIQFPQSKAGDYTVAKDVTTIQDGAFSNCEGLMTITVDPANVNFSSLDGVLLDKSQTKLLQCPAGRSGQYTIPNGVRTIGAVAFDGCSSLTRVTIPDGITTVPFNAFQGCTSLARVTIGKGVTSLGNQAFPNCKSLKGVYFRGSPPGAGAIVFVGDDKATVYYLPGSIGWGTTFEGLPTKLWSPEALADDGNFGIRTNQFGFIVSWGKDVAVVVEGCTDLSNPIWTQISTNFLTGGSSFFNDPQWTNYPARTYRLRSP